MKTVLILGGTSFIGRNLVERLIEVNEFDLTLFNRGLTGATLFPGVKRIVGDRRASTFEELALQHWDFVVDLSCYFPADLDWLLSNLRSKPEKYVFISTCSVYPSTDRDLILRNEQAPILECDRAAYVDKTPATYGNRKAECERILEESGLDHVIFRPAMVYGPYDPTDRLYYWLHQVKFMDELLLPDNGERKFSVTYVQDLVDAIVRALQQGTPSSVYNAITLPEVSIVAIVRAASELLGRSLPFRNAEPSFLKANDVRPWVDMPLWLDGDHFTYSNQRIIEELSLRPSELVNSLKETLAYYDVRGWDVPKYGMGESRRMELLSKCDPSI